MNQPPTTPGSPNAPTLGPRLRRFRLTGNWTALEATDSEERTLIEDEAYADAELIRWSIDEIPGGEYVDDAEHTFRVWAGIQSPLVTIGGGTGRTGVAMWIPDRQVWELLDMGEALYHRAVNWFTTDATPPYAVLWVAEHDPRDPVVNSYQHYARPFYYGVLAVNGPTEVPKYVDSSTPWGTYSLAETPVRARYSADCGITPYVGQRWGPLEDSWDMWPGLPGFRIVGGIDTANYTAMVVRDLTGTFCAKVYSPDTNEATCYQVFRDTGGAEVVYDGSGTFPEQTINVVFPGADTGNALNIAADDIIEYSMGYNYKSGSNKAVQYTAVGTYRDVPSGSIMMWPANLDPPRGWSEYTALQGKFPRGYDGTSPASAAETTLSINTTTTSVQSGSGTTVLTGATLSDGTHTNIPPYGDVKFIQRD